MSGTDFSTPLVSIITVVFNAVDLIEKTLVSVNTQTYTNIEYIVIDGESTDGTVSILRKHQNDIDVLISENDDGIYYAMNKGIERARGAVIAFLNAGDWYETNSVERAIKTITSNNADYAYGTIMQHWPDGHSNYFRPLPYNEFTNRQLIEMPYPHMSAFIRSEVYQQLGGFDTSFHIAADHELAVRIHDFGFKGVEIEGIVGHFLTGGISGGFETNKEIYRLATLHGKRKVDALLRLAWQYLVHITQKVLPNRMVDAIKSVKKSRFT